MERTDTSWKYGFCESPMIFMPVRIALDFASLRLVPCETGIYTG